MVVHPRLLHSRRGCSPVRCVCRPTHEMKDGSPSVVRFRRAKEGLPSVVRFRRAKEGLPSVVPPRRAKEGFTLIELLLVVGIIGSLASVVMEAIGPRKMILSARDASRKQTVRELQNALVQYQIEEGTLPNVDDMIMADDGAKPICKQGVTTDVSCVNVDALIPEYIAALPQDTSETNVNYTGYKIYREPLGGRPQVTSPHFNNRSEGLVGYWPFHEGTGTTAGDGSGKGNNGTLVGSPAWVDGKYGKALQFAGSATYVQVPDNALFTYGSAGFTYAAWIYPTDNTTTHSMIMGEGLPYMSMYGVNRFPFFSIRDSGNTQRSVQGSASLALNQWHHIAAMYDAGGFLRIYVNGVLNAKTTTAFGTPHATGTSAHYIGKYSSGTSFPFIGLIDEVRIYNRALSAEEVAALAQGRENAM